MALPAFPLAAKVTLGVLGGWLAIMAPAVVTVALRLSTFDPSGMPSFYALMLAAGWLTLLVSLITLGQVSDLLLRRSGSRVLLARVGVPLIGVGGLLLAIAPTPGWLLAAWIVAQVPSAAVITTALAEGGDLTPARRRGLTSGLVGAASIIALLLGSTLVRLLGDFTGLAFLVPALLGAVAAAPLLFEPSPQASSSKVQSSSKVESSAAVPAEQSASGSASIGRAFVIAWPIFVAASFLLSWATSTTNGFVVTFIQYVARALGDSIASTTTGAVILATGVAIIASLVAGPLFGTNGRGAFAWTAGAVLSCASLVLMLASPTGALFFTAAAVFGLGFGIANGVELSIVLALRPVHEHLGRDLGLFTAATTAPYVLVPVVATVALADDPRSGVLLLFGLAAVLAAVGAVLTAMINQAVRRSSLGPVTSFTGNSFNID